MYFSNKGLRTSALARVLSAAACAAMLAAFVAPQAQGGTLEIFFSDFDIALDGGTLTDAAPAFGTPEPLLSATFAVDGSFVGTVSTDVTADMEVLGVPALTSGSTVPATGGKFSLDFGGGKFLDLILDTVSITYIDATAVQFVFGAGVAPDQSDVMQDLPFDLSGDPASGLKAPVTLSFSSQVKPGSIVTNGGGEVIAFEAVGTGEVRGGFEPDENKVPEPGTLGLMALAGMMGGVVALRKRLG